MGDMPAATPATLDVPAVEVSVDVTDPDQHGGEQPVVDVPDVPDVALDVDLDDGDGS